MTIAAPRHFYSPKGVVIVHPHTFLRVQFAAGHCATVRELLDQAYTGLYHWLTFLGAPRHETASNATPVPDRHRLCLAAIETVAPAQLEIVGAAEPFQRLGAFLRQSCSPRQRSGAEIELLQQDISIARASALTPDALDCALRRWFIAPLSALNDYHGSDRELACL